MFVQVWTTARVLSTIRDHLQGNSNLDFKGVMKYHRPGLFNMAWHICRTQQVVFIFKCQPDPHCVNGTVSSHSPCGFGGAFVLMISMIVFLRRFVEGTFQSSARTTLFNLRMKRASIQNAKSLRPSKIGWTRTSSSVISKIETRTRSDEMGNEVYQFDGFYERNHTLTAHQRALQTSIRGQRYVESVDLRPRAAARNWALPRGWDHDGSIKLLIFFRTRLCLVLKVGIIGYLALTDPSSGP